MAKEAPTFQVDDAEIIFRNFAGEESQFNTKGDRNFGLILPEELAEQLASDGWNVKTLDAREEGDPDVPWIPVKVSYKNRPPRVTMITSTGGVPMNERNIDTLDYADIQKIDLICRGYLWDVSGKTGIKAYLQTMFVTIREDALERRYAEVISSDDVLREEPNEE